MWNFQLHIYRIHHRALLVHYLSWWWLAGEKVLVTIPDIVTKCHSATITGVIERAAPFLHEPKSVFFIDHVILLSDYCLAFTIKQLMKKINIYILTYTKFSWNIYETRAFEKTSSILKEEVENVMICEHLLSSICLLVTIGKFRQRNQDYSQVV